VGNRSVATNIRALIGSMTFVTRCAQRFFLLASLAAVLCATGSLARATNAGDVPQCEVNGVAVPAAANADLPRNTVSGVLTCRDADTGLPASEQNLKNGVATGPLRIFRNGVIARERTLNAQGQLDGHDRQYGPTGRLQSDTNYQNGKKSGIALLYHPNGKLERVSFFGPVGELAFATFTTRGELSSLECGDKPLLAPTVDDARLCGFPSKLSQLYFVSESGMVRARGTYLAGKRLRFETFQDNGMPAQEEETSAAARIERTYGPRGVKRQEVTWALTKGGAARQSEREFSSGGKLLRERRWADGQLSSESTYFPDGRLRSEARYMTTGSKRILETREFHENGVLAAEGRYIDTGRYAPMPTGIHRQFDVDGHVRSETRFDARGRVHRERSWDVAGNLVRDDEVLEDGSRRPAVGATASVP
jgi:antitoxin component YwqK of YwqJK toxin-antitoxin module